MSFCPACGTAVTEAADARFCAHCGRDLTVPAVPGGASASTPAPGEPSTPGEPSAAGDPDDVGKPGDAGDPVDMGKASVPAQPPVPAAAPTVHVQIPPPPPSGQAPGQPYGVPYAPAAPSPAALFARRVFTGRWDGAALVALVPALTVLALAVLIAGWAGAELPDGAVGMGTRIQSALAVLVQGLGGSLKFSTHFTMSSSDDGFGDGDDGSSFASSDSSTLHSHLSVLPLTVTLLSVLVLVFALRAMRRRRTAAGAAPGPDEAVRVALAAAVFGLVLALVGRPSISGMHVNTSPFLVALWVFLLTLATSLLVLCRPAVDAWLAVRPGPASAFRALGTALTALLATLLFAGAVVWLIAVAHYDDITGWGLAAATLLLLNLGVSGLGLSWGVHFDVSETGPSGDDVYSSGGSYHQSFGLSDLGHVWNGLEVTAVIAGGIVCALAIGLLAAWRSRSRAEMYGVAGIFTVLLVVVAALSGASSGGQAGAFSLVGGGSQDTVGTSVSEALAFGLLWSFGGVVAGSYLWRAAGGTLPPVVAPHAAPCPGPYAPPPAAPGYGAAAGPQPGTSPHVPPQQAPPAPPTVLDLGVVQPDRLGKEPPSDG